MKHLYFELHLTYALQMSKSDYSLYDGLPDNPTFAMDLEVYTSSYIMKTIFHNTNELFGSTQLLMTHIS